MDPYAVYCPEHGYEHQAREHAVDCYLCHKPTFEPHGCCAHHKPIDQTTQIGHGNPHAIEPRLARSTR